MPEKATSSSPAMAMGRTAPIDLARVARSRLPGAAAVFGERNDSLWLDAAGAPELPPGAAELPARADVAIIGAGLTGLWTAYYLTATNPGLKVVVIEANHAAFGASGRAGGWIIGSLDNQSSWLAGLDETASREAIEAIRGTVDEVDRVTAAEGIACGFHKGGIVRVAARHREQLAVCHKYRDIIVAENGGQPIGQTLDADEARRLSRIDTALGGVSFPDCAVVNPAQLCVGLTQSLARRGVRIVSNCRALHWDRQRLVTDHGTIIADWLVPACEGFSDSLPLTRGRMLPVYSHIIATAPLGDALRDTIGFSDRQAFSDCSEISTYGQITEDGRIVFGAFGTYPFGSNPANLPDRRLQERYALVHRTLLSLWPQLEQVPVTHAWSGALGVPRSLRPAIHIDRANRWVWGGGYVGRGLAAANLFGRTIADLVRGEPTPRTALPWVSRDRDLDQTFRRWEPEPLKWLGIAMVTAPGELREKILRSRAPAVVRSALTGLTRLIPVLR
jgi:glycine/D-amino acid oxidase-like deaminating enzyme